MMGSKKDPHSTPTSRRYQFRSEGGRKENIPLIKVNGQLPRAERTRDLYDGQIWSTRSPLFRGSSAEVISITQRESFAFLDAKPAKLTTLWDDESTLTPLLQTVCTGNLEALQTIQMDPFSIEAEEALNLACKKGHNELVEYLLHQNVNVHYKDTKSNFDAVSTATYFNHKEVILSLLSSGQIRALPKVEINDHYLPLLHLASIFGCFSAVDTLVNNTFLRVDIDERDQDHWRALHYSIAHGHQEISRFLLDHNADPNSEGLYKVCPLHIAAYKRDFAMAEMLLDCDGDPKKMVSLNPPRNSFSFERRSLDRRDSRALPLIVFYNSRIFSTLLHWAVSKASCDLVKKMIDKGAMIDTHDIEGFTPLGLALTEGKKEIVQYFSEIGVRLSDEDKNWRRIKSEEMGLRVVKILESTNLDGLDCSNKEGFSILHLAASEGYLSLLNRILSREVDPDLETIRGETALFYAVESNQQACMEQLLRAGANIFHVSKKNSSLLHAAAKCNNFAAIDKILTSLSKDKLDINLADENGFTAIYYAINKGRYDIVQRFVQYCVSNALHVKATHHESLLQFYTERNILDQYDNNIVRVLELEKALHKSKTKAEKCIRMQLGTTYASTKAREQLQAMYDSTNLQLNFWYIWLILSCFLMPSALYFLDVYTDVVLAVEYFNDYVRAVDNGEDFIKKPFEIFKNITETQSKINFVLTVFFLLIPMILLGVWSTYIHITQPDIFPSFRRMAKFQRIISYCFLFITPIGPIVSYMENTYAQINYMNKTSEISFKEYEEDSSVVHPSGDRLREYYSLKHVAQMRVAINNVLEASLESAFQLVLQLYILGTQYSQLYLLEAQGNAEGQNGTGFSVLHFGDITLGSILSLTPTSDPNTRLSKQVLSVLISLVSLTWSFTAYHRFSKLGGLRILCSLPLLFAIFFQIISRAIACTIFTLAYTWRIFVVLGVHYLIVFLAKGRFEQKTNPPKADISSYKGCFSIIRSYFYVLLGTFTSTFVYFRIRRPQEEREYLSPRHSSFFIQTLFLILAFAENVSLFGIGLANLKKDRYNEVFRIVSGVLLITSFIIGAVLQYLYYACFGHPWVNINGPAFERNENGDRVISFYDEGGHKQLVIHSLTNCTKTTSKEDDDCYMPVPRGEQKNANFSVSNGRKRSSSFL